MERLCERIEARAGALAFVAAFALYLWLAAPGEYWLDSAEFVGVGYGLGIGHAPGEPVYALLAKAATLIPLGGIAFRVVLLSVTCQAGVIALLVCGVRRAARALGAAPAARVGACGLALALGGLAVSSRWQGSRPEVYALNTLLILAAAAALWTHLERVRAGRRDQRGLLLAALALGLGLGVHPLVSGLALLPALLALALWDRAALRPHTLLLAASFALLGLTAYAYLPLRAHDQLGLNWGNPTRLGSWLDVVSGRSFQRSFTATAGPGLLARAQNLSLWLMAELHPLALVCALGGLALLARRARAGAAAAALAALVLCSNLASVGLQRSLDLDNPDVGGYLQPSVLLLTGLAALAPLLAAARWPQRARALGGGLAAVAALGGLLAVLDAAAGGRGRPVRSYAARDAPLLLLDAQPPDTLLLSASNQATFSMWSLQVVEGARPDVTIVFRGFLAAPWFRAPLQRQLPALAAAQRPGGAADLDPDAMSALARQRPIVWEPFGFREFRDDGLDLLLHPGAGYFQVGEPGPEAPYTRFAWIDLLNGDHLDRSFALLHHFVRASKASALGLDQLFAQEIALARALAPDDPDVAALARGAP